MALDTSPSQTENESFALRDAELVKEMRARLDAERERRERASHRLRCPGCGGRLAEREHHHVKIDVCPDCGGVWLDKGELELLERVDQSHVRRFIGDLFGLKD